MKAEEFAKEIEKNPSFEVHDRKTGNVYKIWWNGEIEGFPPECWIINRVNILRHAALSAMRQLETAQTSNVDLPPQD